MSDKWIPDACTLPTDDRPLRIAEFGDLFKHVRQSTRPEPTLLRLVLPTDVEAAARDLARRESECCSFFTFEFEAAGNDVVMRIEVPVAQVALLDAIETRAARRARATAKCTPATARRRADTVARGRVDRG